MKRIFLIALVSAFFSMPGSVKASSCDKVAERIYMPLGLGEFNPDEHAFDARCVAPGIDICIYHNSKEVRLYGDYRQKTWWDHTWALDLTAPWTSLNSGGDFELSHMQNEFVPDGVTIFGWNGQKGHNETTLTGIYKVRNDFKQLEGHDGQKVPCSPLPSGYVPDNFASLFRSVRTEDGNEFRRGSLLMDSSGRLSILGAIIKFDNSYRAMRVYRASSLTNIPSPNLRSAFDFRELVDNGSLRYHEYHRFPQLPGPDALPLNIESLFASSRPAQWKDIETSSGYGCVDFDQGPNTPFTIRRHSIEGHKVEFLSARFKISPGRGIALRTEGEDILLESGPNGLMARTKENKTVLRTVVMERPNKSMTPYLLAESYGNTNGQRRRYACWIDPWL